MTETCCWWLIINKVVYRLNLYLFYLLVYLKHSGDACLKITHFYQKLSKITDSTFPFFTCLHLFWLSSEPDLMQLYLKWKQICQVTQQFSCGQIWSNIHQVTMLSIFLNCQCFTCYAQLWCSSQGDHKFNNCPTENKTSTHIHNVKLTNNTSNYSDYSKTVIHAQPTLQYTTFPQLAEYPCATRLCLSDFKFHHNALIFST